MTSAKPQPPPSVGRPDASTTETGGAGAVNRARSESADRVTAARLAASMIGYVSWGQADACGWGSLSSLDLLRFVSAVPTLVGPALWGEMTERPAVINDAGQRAAGPMGLGWGVAEQGHNKGIHHNGAWPGERSLAVLRGDGGSFALLVNSDDARRGEIAAAAATLLGRTSGPGPQSPGWQDYGYPS